MLPAFTTARARCLLVAIALLSLIGCGPSQSYKLAVADAYPKVATRIDAMLPNTPAAQGLRDAAVAPISFAKASSAWATAAPVYRSLVAAATLTPHRKSDWLVTADLLDKLNADEAKHEAVIYFAPPPTTQPVKGP